MYIEYKEDINALNNNINNVKVGYRQGITNAVWLDDKDQLAAILAGVNALPGISYVRVLIGSEVYASSGASVTENVVSSSFLLQYEYDGRLLTIGETFIEANASEIYERLMNRLWVLLASNAIKTFLVATFMFYLFDRLVFRRLNQIFNFVKHHDIHNLNSRVHFDIESDHKKNDEISMIANALNQMQEHLSSSLNELLRVKTTLDLSPDCIVMCYPGSYQFFYANTGAAKLLGYHIKDLINMAPADICPDLKEDYFTRLSSHKTDDLEHAVDIETDFVHENGSLIPVKLILQYLNPENEEPRFVFIARDITKRKKDEMMLLKSLEDANTASEAKSKFLMSMSHELRTPLNAVIGFSQLLTLEADTLTSEQNESVKDISQGGKHLLKLVEDILDLSRIESNNMALSLERIDPIDLINECIKTVTPMAQMKYINVENKITDVSLPKIKIDKTRFKQVLLNLLSNAIKYNNNGGSVTLTCELLDNNIIRFKITDTGYGIEASEQSNVFTAFSRLGHEGGQIEGTGIGLNITKRLVVLMNGVIDFESRAGEGSDFWIEFPTS